LKPRDIWAIRFYLDEHRRLRDRALFDLAIDSKLRGCDLVKLRIGDLVSGGSFRDRATVIQQKTGRPVQFEIVTEARKGLEAWPQTTWWRTFRLRVPKPDQLPWPPQHTAIHAACR
jgi:integrase